MAGGLIPRDQTEQVADLYKKVRRLAAAGSAGGGSVDLTPSILIEPVADNAVILTGSAQPVSDVMGTTWATVPITFYVGTTLDITVNLTANGPGTYEALTRLYIMDPLTGDFGFAMSSWEPVTSGPPASLSTASSGTVILPGTTTGLSRASSGPIVGWAAVAVTRDT